MGRRLTLAIDVTLTAFLGLAGGAILTGADLTNVASGTGGITGSPAALPPNWAITSGFLIGPTANLVSADLHGLNLSGADLASAVMSSANLTASDLSGANVTSADLSNTDLSSANLTSANLTGAYLAQAKFGGADLGGAMLSAATLASVSSGGHAIEVTLTGPKIRRATGRCRWNGTGRHFVCALRIPRGVRPGRRYWYKLTAQESVGTGFVAAPAIGPATNPLIIHFTSHR